MKKWQIVNNLKTKDNKQRIDEIIKLLLENRGLKTNKQIDEFLNPPNPISQTLNPSTLGINAHQLKKAIQRIEKAIDNKESIVVYGDYDADGICGTALLWESLNKLGAKVMPYIPHRVDEGYGLSQKGIDTVKSEYNADLIITVDHGIGAVEKINYAKKQEIEVIITDHHVVPDKLPDALAIIHTTQLCGAGVAWMLVKEIIQTTKNSELITQNSLDLVAIATIADMVPLTEANRTLVIYGLKELNHTKRIGLQALMREAGIERGGIGTYEISHLLAPRLNAMGRLEHAMDSLRLLCTNDEKRSFELAKLLDKTNRARQDLVEQTLIHAKNYYHETENKANKLIFLHHESYQQGVIGLVAGKLVEEFYRPAIVVSWGETYSKASARSINGFNIIETIRKAQDLLVDCGGHPMAAGFTVETKNLISLQKKLVDIANQELDDEKLTRVLKIDCELKLDDLTFNLYEELSKFKPFGLGNPEPVFTSKGVIVEDVRIIGSGGKHLRMTISDDSSTIFPAIAFCFGGLCAKLKPDHPIDIAYTLSVNEWKGNKKLELKIKDIRLV
ncbi:MAG: single-stranded-DNA-specific exonuclease RecJ [Candidatus Gottesmanbacteria bacterium]